MRCDGQWPCSFCKKYSFQCVFTEARQKRGPRPRKSPEDEQATAAPQVASEDTSSLNEDTIDLQTLALSDLSNNHKLPK